MNILVTGARGQVGWELARSLMPLGEVVALDRRQCDLSDPLQLREVVARVAPALIVNAAAYTAVDKAESEPELAMRINADAVAELGALARARGALLLHYSTDYVFDGQGDTPRREQDPVSPPNVYGASKLAGEQALAASGCDYLILRTTWVYAARGGNFLRTMLRLGAERERLAVVADQIGAPTWARNLADASALLAARACAERSGGRFSPEVLNLTAAGETSWHGFAEAIFAGASARGASLAVREVAPIATADYPTSARRPLNSRLDGGRLMARFGIQLPDWRQGLERCLDELLGEERGTP